MRDFSSAIEARSSVRWRRAYRGSLRKYCRLEYANNKGDNEGGVRLKFGRVRKMSGLHAVAVISKERMFGRRAERRILAALAGLLAVPGVLFSSAAGAEPQEAAWEFSLTPYLWLPHLDAALRYETPGNGGTPISMTDLLKHLDGALFLSGEARKGRWGLATDLVYCDFQKVGSDVTTVTSRGGQAAVPINTGTTTNLTGYMVSVTGNYSLVREPNNNFDVLAGVRYTHIGTTLDWSFDSTVGSLPARTGSAEQGIDLWDGVAGFRGKASFAGGKWFVPYYLDAGTGTSKFTWQGMLGVGYAFSWGDLLLAYRYLSFEQGDSEPVEHFRLSGLALGATFHF